MPLLYVIALIGAVVLTSLLSLILSVYVLEQQKDYAIMKALGAPVELVPGIVINSLLYWQAVESSLQLCYSYLC